MGSNQHGEIEIFNQSMHNAQTTNLKQHQTRIPRDHRNKQLAPAAAGGRRARWKSGHLLPWSSPSAAMPRLHTLCTEETTITTTDTTNVQSLLDPLPTTYTIFWSIFWDISCYLKSPKTNPPLPPPPSCLPSTKNIHKGDRYVQENRRNRKQQKEPSCFFLGAILPYYGLTTSF
uniref:Uncharacterized protein n=1 Tax=Arundo donax TaxID=35708 RepID=A0A0A9A6K9_ARUDO